MEKKTQSEQEKLDKKFRNTYKDSVQKFRLGNEENHGRFPILRGLDLEPYTVSFSCILIIYVDIVCIVQGTHFRTSFKLDMLISSH